MLRRLTLNSELKRFPASASEVAETTGVQHYAQTMVIALIAVMGYHFLNLYEDRCLVLAKNNSFPFHYKHNHPLKSSP